MASKTWQDIYADKLVPAEEALSRIRSGQTVFIGAGASEPLLLSDALAEMAGQYSDIEIIRLFAPGKRSRLTDPELDRSFHINTFYHGRGVSGVKVNTIADYTPMNLVDLPRAFSSGIVRIDAALVQVAPPNRLGLCSLGVSVDATKAAVENAALVIAQVNENMPETTGDSLIPMENFDFLVEGTAELSEVPLTELDPVSLTIGRHIAGLIEDGMTLHFDRGPIGAATMR